MCYHTHMENTPAEGGEDEAPPPRSAALGVICVVNLGVVNLG